MWPGSAQTLGGKSPLQARQWNCQPVGKLSVIKFSVGAQIGGQGFSEILFFKNKESLESFKQDNKEVICCLLIVSCRYPTPDPRHLPL
jgi:hypothetical protein